jgi:hypothetical protein
MLIRFGLWRAVRDKTWTRYICRNRCLCPQLRLWERVLGREREAKAVREREKGTCDSLVATCEGDLGKRTRLGLVPRGTLYRVRLCNEKRFVLFSSFFSFFCVRSNVALCSQVIVVKVYQVLSSASVPREVKKFNHCLLFLYSSLTIKAIVALRSPFRTAMWHSRNVSELSEWPVIVEVVPN